MQPLITEGSQSSVQSGVASAAGKRSDGDTNTSGQSLAGVVIHPGIQAVARFALVTTG
ncbi:hypothetical protein D3C84_1210700 [compost metagenome]